MRPNDHFQELLAHRRRPTRTRGRRTAPIALVALAFGCQGAIGDPGVYAPNGVDDLPRMVAADNAQAPLRRLTREEYDRTLAAILGAETPSAEFGFVEDELSGPFNLNAVSPVAEVSVEHYAIAAEALASRTSFTFDECDLLDDVCAEEFVRGFGRRVYRRALTDAEVERFGDLHSAQATFEDGIRLIVQVMLQSPHFLYHSLDTDDGARLTSFAYASRLSFFLWRAAPDEALLTAAESGELDTPHGVEEHIARLMRAPEALDTLVAFHRQWLGLRELDKVDADGLDDELRAAMHSETETFIREVMSETGSFAELMTAPRSYPSPRLAQVYDVDEAVIAANYDTGNATPLDENIRGGLLTQPSILAATFSPVRRGKFVREVLLCQTIVLPSFDIPELPPLMPGLSPRERWEMHTADPGCAACHSRMDPIGFGFDHFDNIGRYRTEFEGGFPIEGGGELSGTSDADGAFDSVPVLASRLARSRDVQRCVAQRWLHFAVGRGPGAGDADFVDEVLIAFERSDFDVRALVTAIAVSDRFRLIPELAHDE